MKREDLTFQTGFRVSVGNERSQGAVMVLARGGCEGGPDNQHRSADQWLLVLSGTGTAVNNGHRVPLRAGSLVLIERGDTPEIRNTGRSLLKTVSVYAPPAYKADGDQTPLLSKPLFQFISSRWINRSIRGRCDPVNKSIVAEPGNNPFCVVRASGRKEVNLGTLFEPTIPPLTGFGHQQGRGRGFKFARMFGDVGGFGGRQGAIVPR